MRSHPVRPAFAAVADAPISQMNTTPLIDVMLVLLIMVILTVPLATHAVKIDLPAAGRINLDEPEKHRLALDGGGRLFWDGAPISEASLPGRLHAFRYVRPDGVLEVQSEAETRYDAFDRVLATVKRSGIEKLGFVGNERFARDIE
ncbi:MAG TPA: biopolymer transporter ExbD [Allosphingosinicella sp.]|jgi:biopolymer transport protein ExbD